MRLGVPAGWPQARRCGCAPRRLRAKIAGPAIWPSRWPGGVTRTRTALPTPTRSRRGREPNAAPLPHSYRDKARPCRIRAPPGTGIASGRAVYQSFASASRAISALRTLIVRRLRGTPLAAKVFARAIACAYGEETCFLRPQH